MHINEARRLVAGDRVYVVPPSLRYAVVATVRRPIGRMRDLEMYEVVDEHGTIRALDATSIFHDGARAQAYAHSRPALKEYTT